MSIARFGVRKHVVANLVMFALIGAGLFFGTSLRREFFPFIESRIVSVTAPYPGAAPEEIEDALAVKIEDAVADIDGVKEITTSVSEGVCTVLVEFVEGFGIEQAVTDVQREVDALMDLPDEVDNIVVDKIEQNLPAIIVALYSDTDERTRKEFIEQVRDDLLSIDGITEIGIGGTRTDEIRVELDPARAIEHGLSLTAVADRIRAAMTELPGGSVRTDTSTISVRSVGVEERSNEIRDIPLKSVEGGVIRVRDVAEVTDGFVDIDLRARYEGEPTVTATVLRVGDQDIITLSDKVKAYVAGRNGEDITLDWKEKIALAASPPGTDPTEVSDRLGAHALGAERFAQAPPPGTLMTTTELSRFVKGRLDLLTRNAAIGGVLVFLVLVLLLNWRISLWVALGLAVSLLGTLALMSWVGASLNLLSMFGLIIVIGILVDDAIVVAENIASHHESGENAYRAAVSGTDQVTWPVVSTVLTTICAFLPLALLDGQIGDFMRVLPIIVGVSLAISLVETLFILPSHMATSMRGVDKRREQLARGDGHGAGLTGMIGRLEERYDTARDAVINRKILPLYARFIDVSMRYRYITIACALAVLTASAGMVVSGRLEFVFFEDDDAETININVTMPIGTPVERTDEVVRRFEKVCMAQPEVQSTFAQAGALSDLEGRMGTTSAPHVGQLILELYPAEDRDVQSSELIERVRGLVGPVPDAKSIRLAGQTGGPSGSDLNYTVTSEFPERLEAAVRVIKEEMSQYDAVYGVSDDADKGQREVRFTLRDGAAELGFTRANLGRQIQGMVFGLEAFTFAGNREDVDVRVMSPERVRRSLGAIELQYVYTPAGVAVPLGEVARIEESRSYATIRRIDRRRAIAVSADVNRAMGNPERIAAELKPRIESRLASIPGVDLLERGRQKDLNESFSSLPVAMLAAAGLIYVILAWLFSSFAQPLIVMSAIPFATIGMIWGHIALGFSLTFLSLIGFVALAGVVVNDSLIFMQFFNERRAQGLSVHDAGVEAGLARFRAIMLTTITTVFGLLPMMLERSFQAQFLIPMAITIACGLMSATAIILIVLPCLLKILDDAVHLFRVLWSGDPTLERRNPRTEDPALAALEGHGHAGAE